MQNVVDSRARSPGKDERAASWITALPSGALRFVWCSGGRDIAKTATLSPRPAAESLFYFKRHLLRQSLHDLTPFGFERILSGA
jgi:hypothetical protein